MLDVLDRAGHSRRSTRPPPSACVKPQPCSHIKVTIPIESLPIAGPAMRSLRRLQTCALCSRQVGSRHSKRFPVLEGELREALPNLHGRDGGPIWNACAAQPSRTISSALYRESGRSCPSACTKRFTWKRSSNWKRPCTRRMEMPSRASVRDDWQSCAPRWSEKQRVRCLQYCQKISLCLAAIVQIVTNELSRR